MIGRSRRVSIWEYRVRKCGNLHSDYPNSGPEESRAESIPFRLQLLRWVGLPTRPPPLTAQVSSIKPPPLVTAQLWSHPVHIKILQQKSAVR